MTDTFYTDLPALDRFDRLAEPDAYTPVPPDWTVDPAFAKLTRTNARCRQWHCRWRGCEYCVSLRFGGCSQVSVVLAGF